MANSNAEIPLSEGSIANILKGHEVSNPVLKIQAIKKLIDSLTNLHRYRMQLFDGRDISKLGLLDKSLNSLVEENKLGANSIVKVIQFALASMKPGVNEKKTIVISKLEILRRGPKVEEKMKTRLIIKKDLGLSSKSNLPVVKPIPALQSPVVGIKRSLLETFPKTESPSKRRLTNSSSTGDDTSYLPIADLKPSESNWTIRGKVSTKQVKPWSKGGIPQQILTFNMTDSSGTIRVVGFTEYISRHLNVIQADKIYYLTRGKIKKVVNQYKCGHAYEIHITNTTEIKECKENIDLPAVQYKFSKIKFLKEMPCATLVDVVGVIYTTEECTRYTQENKPYIGKDVILLDDSQHMVSLTLWGDQAEKFDANNNTIVAIKSGKIKDYMTAKSLVMSSSTLIAINPDIPEVHELRRWFENKGPKDAIFPNISRLRSITVDRDSGNVPLMSLTDAYLKIRHSTNTNEQIIFITKAFVTKIDGVHYLSCIQPNCRKKVEKTAHIIPKYFCRKCNIVNETYKNRIFMKLRLDDYYFTQEVTMSKGGEVLFGKSIDYLVKLIEDNWEAEYDDHIEHAIFKEFTFKIKLYYEFFMSEYYIKAAVLSVENVDYKAEEKLLKMKA